MHYKEKNTNAVDFSAGKSSSRILLAEDDFEMRKLLAWSLRNQGYSVIECKDGLCLLRKLGIGGDAEHEAFDLIITDVRMPGVTGLEVLEANLEFEELPPIILITAFPDKKTLDDATKLGAAAILAKPFDIDDLLTQVGTLVPVYIDAAEKKVKSVRPKFPVEITFRRRKAIPVVNEYIRERAAKLNQFSENIQHCRVVIDELHKDDLNKHTYHVEVVLDVPGKPLIGKYDSDIGQGEENLYSAIHIAFARVFRELKELAAKQRHYRKGQAKISTILKEDLK
jgi:CheY-like chemotaxis protein